MTSTKLCVSGDVSDTQFRPQADVTSLERHKGAAMAATGGMKLGFFSRLIIIYSDLIDCFNASYVIGFCLIILLPQVHRSFEPTHHHHTPAANDTTTNNAPVTTTTIPILPQLNTTIGPLDVQQLLEQKHHDHHHHDHLPIGEILICIGFFIFYFVRLIKCDKVDLSSSKHMVNVMKGKFVILVRYFKSSAFPDTTIITSTTGYTNMDHLYDDQQSIHHEQQVDNDKLVEIVSQSDSSYRQQTNNNNTDALVVVNVDNNDMVAVQKNIDIEEIESCTIAEHHHDCCYELIHQIGDYSSSQQQQQHRKKSTHIQSTSSLANIVRVPTSPATNAAADYSNHSTRLLTEHSGKQEKYSYGATKTSLDEPRIKQRQQQQQQSLSIEIPVNNNNNSNNRSSRIDLYKCNSDFILLFTILSSISIIDGLMFSAYFNASSQNQPPKAAIVTNMINNISAIASGVANGNLPIVEATITATLNYDNVNDTMDDINDIDDIDDSDEAHSIQWIQTPDRDGFIRHILCFLLHKLILALILALEYRYHLNRTINSGNYHDQLRARSDRDFLTSLARNNNNNKKSEVPNTTGKSNHCISSSLTTSSQHTNQKLSSLKQEDAAIVVVNENSLVCLGFISVVIFLLTTPLGVVVGSLIGSRATLHIVVTIYAVLRAFATGFLLYIAFFVILPKNDSKDLSRPLAMAFGFVLLLLVAIYVPYPG